VSWSRALGHVTGGPKKRKEEGKAEAGTRGGWLSDSELEVWAM